MSTPTDHGHSWPTETSAVSTPDYIRGGVRDPHALQAQQQFRPPADQLSESDYAPTRFASGRDSDRYTIGGTPHPTFYRPDGAGSSDGAPEPLPQ